MEKLRVEALFASSPFYLRYESVLTPFLRIGEKWDSHGSCLGVSKKLPTTTAQEKKQKKHLTLHSTPIEY